jgi:hypothetical protein
LCVIKSIRKPRRSTLLSLYNSKYDFYTRKHHTANNLKLQNIAMLLEPIVNEDADDGPYMGSRLRGGRKCYLG